jgi:ankyrin repeat protein
VSLRSLPARPNLDQLKRQAKERLRLEPALGRLRDAQRITAEEYGFESWDALKKHVESVVGPASRSMIKPTELESVEGESVWSTLTAAADGNVDALARLLERDSQLTHAEFWYAPAIHFAVREGHLEAVRLLLDAGADPESNGLHDVSLIEMARDRGHTEIAALLEQVRHDRGRTVAGPEDHPLHAAIDREDADAVRRLLDADPSLVDLGNKAGASPLHRAVGRGVYDLVALLLERGANVHAVLSSAHGLSGGFWAGLQAIDLAIWHGRRRGDRQIIGLLLDHGATLDLAVASALGDIERVKEMLDANPGRIRETRPSGRRPLSAAVETGNDAIARVLLHRGVHPSWPEPTAPKGRSLHSAAMAGNLPMVQLLLAHGADPNGDIDSSGSPVSAAATAEIRAVLEAHGGLRDSYDTTWIERDEDVQRVANDPREAHRIAPSFTMVVSDGQRDKLARLLAAGLRLPPVVTGCQGYLLAHNDMLRTLLAHGMSPDLMNWQRQTLLHHLCSQRHPTAATIEAAAILLDAGANISARDEEYRSTPLAWAARTNAPNMVRFLLSRGAPTHLPDDEEWATPLRWAERRGHREIVAILEAHGADR